jgi:hypothetical protein
MKFFFYPGNKTVKYVDLRMSKSPINNLAQKHDGSTNSNSNCTDMPNCTDMQIKQPQPYRVQIFRQSKNEKRFAGANCTDMPNRRKKKDTAPT